MGSMTIEQTVTITDDHWLHFELPLDLPLGRARVELTVTPEHAHAVKAADKWVNPLRGRAKALGLQLSPERVLEMQREDVKQENAIDERLRRRGYCCSSGSAERMTDGDARPTIQ